MNSSNRANTGCIAAAWLKALAGTTDRNTVSAIGDFAEVDRKFRREMFMIVACPCGPYLLLQTQTLTQLQKPRFRSQILKDWINLYEWQPVEAFLLRLLEPVE